MAVHNVPLMTAT